MSDSGTSSEKNDLKSLLVKGMIGAVTLAGTTAIPIVIQQSLQHHPSTPTASPTASASPTATVPTQASPTPAPVSATPTAVASPVQGSSPPDSPQIHPAAATYQTIGQDEGNDKPGKKGKKKHKDD